MEQESLPPPHVGGYGSGVQRAKSGLEHSHTVRPASAEQATGRPEGKNLIADTRLGGDDQSRHPERAVKSVERLFPFVLRAGILMIGRETLGRHKGKLHFVLITEDISAAIRAEILADFKHYPVVQHYGAADLEKFFNVKGAKTIGFTKSGLAQSIYAELKAYRINPHVTPARREVAAKSPQTAH